MAPQSSALLASFQRWAHRSLGSCAAVWDVVRPAAAAKTGRWKSSRNMLYGAFAGALKALGWGDGPDDASVIELCATLDFYGCGFVSHRDLQWLDTWRAPEWLWTEPDYPAWAELRGRMLKAFGRPLRAWRSLLDVDDTNLVCWKEFFEACQRLRFKGNIPGAWRCLDKDVSGYITLHEYDAVAADLLASFKLWVEKNYGSVEFAFRSIDNDGSGAITQVELQRACRRSEPSWDRSVSVLFDCLGIEATSGKRMLSHKDLTFLDSWLPDLSALEHEVRFELQSKERSKSCPPGSSTPERQLPQLPVGQRKAQVPTQAGSLPSLGPTGLPLSPGPMG